MRKRHTNSVIHAADGIATIDLATPRYPTAVALIDEADIALVIDGGGRWNAFRTPRSRVTYAVRHIGPAADRRQQWMHRVILGLGPLNINPERIDHRNSNGLDNTRLNLRIATPCQNAANFRLSRRNKSGFKGVTYRKDKGYWRAELMWRGQPICLAPFDSAQEAADAYQTATSFLNGEFARSF